MTEHVIDDACLLLVGCGNMGGALLAGWRGKGVASNQISVMEADPHRAASLVAAHGVTVVAEAAGPVDVGAPNVIVLAVKPAQISEVLPVYAGLVEQGALVLSVAAGCTIADLARAAGGDPAIVRAMPNTPAAVGRGMTVACANARVSADQKATADALLSAVGRVAWVEDEVLMDAVTAVSGSGPAYVFLLAECLEEAGTAAGLPPSLAAELARETIIGAAALLDADGSPPYAHRKRVTSPGGTTAAALDVLRAEGGLAALLTAAVQAAEKRSRQLSGGGRSQE